LPLVAIVAFLLVALWIAVQASPWTPKSWHHPVWFASPVAEAKSAITADPSQTWKTLGWWNTLAIFVVAVNLGTNATRSLSVLKVMLGTCVFVGVFGIIVEVFELNTLGIMPKTYYEGWLTGTFVSRNSAASFLGIGLVIALRLASREILRPENHSARLSSNTICDFINRAGSCGPIAMTKTRYGFSSNVASLRTCNQHYLGRKRTSISNVHHRKHCCQV
jgi:hypothetical protein